MKEKINRVLDIIINELDKLPETKRITLDQLISDCNLDSENLSSLFVSEMVRYVIHSDNKFELRRGKMGGIYRINPSDSTIADPRESPQDGKKES